MGNGIGRLSVCFAGDAGEISRRRHDIAIYLSDPLDEGLGHSFCYIRPDTNHIPSSGSKLQFQPDDATTAFRSISGASISANTSTPLSTALVDLCPYNNVLDKASSFESSDSFASIPLQLIPRDYSIQSIQSLPIPRCSGAGWGSGPIERGFLSGPIERSFISGPLEQHQSEPFQRYKPKPKKWALLHTLKQAISKSIVAPIRGSQEPDWADGLEKKIENLTVSGTNSNNLSSQLSSYDEDDELFESRNLQWAQGKAGEDRVHIVVSEEHGWVFVGIYDGFNGPDATDFLVNNLYSNIHKELKGLLWNEKIESTKNSISEDGSIRSIDGDLNSGCDWNRDTAEIDMRNINHCDVLKALSEALRKTEESFLEIADLMVKENPELSLMGSCVLVMLMKGDDVYLMNVGDSRAVIALQKAQSDLRVKEEDLNDVQGLEDYKFESLPNLNCLQLTVDHSASVDEEVRRVKSEHRDDPSAITNERVKGSLKVTRAFGAGFLKQPKWNNALLEMFRIDYVGTSPYINCLPSIYHHRLSQRDKFLILSSDGLYQYFTNQEAVSQVELFISSFPEGDPAQHLVEEVLFRAAKKAGMDFHELLEIPQGDRRRYHDDVSIIIISLQGRIWRSSL